MSEEKENKIDLSALENFEVEPAWVKSNEQNQSFHKQAKGKDFNKRERAGGNYEKKEKRRGKREYRPNKGYDKNKTRVYFNVLPKKEVLQQIKDQMRKTGISYGLADICDTIIAKNQRYLIKLSLEEKDVEKGALFTITKIDGKVFTTREKALDHLLVKHFDEAFAKKEESEEMPKKSFQYVYQCPKTNKLLPPNNYHNFSEVVRQHIFTNNIDLTFENFVSKLKKTEESERIEEWISTPLKSFKYAISGKEDTWYDSIEKLRSACFNSSESNLLISQQIVKIDGSDLNLLETHVSDQFNTFFKIKGKWINELFVACLVNFKKSNFTIFKSNEKKHTYASAYKRRNLDSNSLNEISTKIIGVLKKEKIIKKGKLVKIEELVKFESKKVLIEIKWLVKEGYISEFANGNLSIN